MTDRSDEAAAADKAPPTPADKRRASPWRAAAAALAAALLLVATLVATAPRWAPLLPWGASADRNERALAARLDRLQAAQQRDRQTAAALQAALLRSENRLDALATQTKRPTGEIAALRQELARLSRAEQDMTARLEALDKEMRAHAGRDTRDIGMALVLLQIRNAVAVGRPFATEYQSLAKLTQGRPEIAKATAPLAAPATTGAASRAVLAKGLRDLAAELAVVKPLAAPGWTGEALARLRGLVTIRRLDGAAPSDPAAAVNAAELALAGGDLRGAVAAVGKLTGASAEAARPWLRMARQRLAVDAALERIAALLAGGIAAAAAAAGPTP